jgi:hypothetical protein
MTTAERLASIRIRLALVRRAVVIGHAAHGRRVAAQMARDGNALLADANVGRAFYIGKDATQFCREFAPKLAGRLAVRAASFARLALDAS